MPQYTSTSTSPGGTTVNTVLDTGLNTITITATTPAGTVATTTFDATVTDLINPVVNLRDQLSAAEPTLSRTDLSSGVRNAVISTVNDVKSQATSASAVATATDTTVPSNPTPVTPVKAENIPNATPAATTPPIENAAPAPTTNPDINNGAIGLGVDTAIIQQTVADDTAAKQANALAAADGLITPSVQQDITTDAETAQVNALAARDGLITPSVQQDITSDTETAQVNALAARDGLITPAVQQQINAIGVKKAEAQGTATNQNAVSFQKTKDWRVRISLAPNSNYLYNAPSPGILAPLSGKAGTNGTNGVIFPYTPAISVSYAAGYDPTEITHSNYKIFQYKSSSVDNISITGDFTAQDTNEANYMLAVIHFFRSVTKMFYGQDNDPKNGVPPPLVYLSGFGAYQFDNHPMVITNFTYNTPTDVDYIRAGSVTNMPGQSVAQQPNIVNTSSLAASAIRLLTSNLTPRLPNFQTQNSAINSDATYVPTKISIALTAYPIVSRNDISNRFSLQKYATGQLLQGSKNNSGGIW
jgi:hypothetical protein